MEENNIPFFRNLWQENVADLQKLCEIWENISMTNSVPEEVHGDIRTNIGLAKLLMNQKLKQFNGLIDDSEFNTGEKEITCLDLQGFWDMVYTEVEKIKKIFDRLEKCKNNEWKVEDEDSEKLLKKKVPVKRGVAVSSKNEESSKSQALAAKQRLAEFKKKMLAKREQQNEQNSVDRIESNSTETVMAANVKNSNGNSKQELPKINGKRMPSLKLSNQIETVVLNEEDKSRTNLQKGYLSSIQNKENFMPDSDLSDVKPRSKSDANSKETKEAIKKRGKSKDYGKLQCVTRSAKKALLTQPNTS